MIRFSVFLMNPTYSTDEAPKAYAKSQISEVWSMEKFAKHIADHNGVYSRGTVRGVISDMSDCLVEQLLNGNKIELGELGSFSISLSSEGAESMEAFTAKNIKAVNIVFTPGEQFENLVNRAEFGLVSSRAAQVATLKAEKAGESTVDLAAAKGGSSSTSGSASDTNGGSSSNTNPSTPSTDGEENVGGEL